MYKKLIHFQNKSKCVFACFHIVYIYKYMKITELINIQKWIFFLYWN